WRLELTRLLVTEILLVTLLLLVVSWARTREALAWSAALSVLALTPLAFTGHSASALGHETTVTGLGLHLVGLSVWVGGLMAIAMLLPVLGRALPDTVRRYSVLALWSYVAVGLSGVIFSTVTLGGLGNLTTPYGLVIVAKVVLLVVLGVFG